MPNESCLFYFQCRESLLIYCVTLAALQSWQLKLHVQDPWWLILQLLAKPKVPCILESWVATSYGKEEVSAALSCF
ncbi:unnamed protein product [Prunus armeniaca]|nr:unnamed protein product [Prunus armeniaca]